MRKFLNIALVTLAWFAVIAQFVLMMQNRVAGIGETVVRFFSFFTILTNTLVAVYFSDQLLNRRTDRKHLFEHRSFLTALTVYITIVGIVYQVALRHVWQPTGLQMIVDELLHSVIPACVIVYWIIARDRSRLPWKDLPRYLIYPVIYITYVLIRGGLSGFYPYPFIDVSDLGWPTTMINIAVLILVFVVLASVFIGIGNVISKNKRVAIEHES